MSATEIRPETAPKLAQIALVGSPNTGKSTLFNRLTGLKQRVANFPGVTVEGRLGRLTLGSRACELLDLPGTYSLSATALDELVVTDALTGQLPAQSAPDLVLMVLEASHLERHLLLAAQVADLGVPMVIAANLMDEAENRGLQIDFERLQRQLGVPIVPTIATTGEGLPALRDAIDEALVNPSWLNLPPWPEAVIDASERLQELVLQDTGKMLEKPLARRFLFDAKPLAAERLGWAPEQCQQALNMARQPIRESGLHPLAAETLLLKRLIRQWIDGVIEQQTTPETTTWTERVDKVLIHRLSGPIIFAVIMYGVFQAIYTGAGPLMDGIDSLTGMLQGVVTPLLAPWPMLQDLVVTGIIGGVGGVVIFLPQICILYLCVCLLEDTGYMARAAFMMDRLLGWCGLNGRSFIPMLSSYACAIPGVMAARTINDPKARLTTVLIAPLMSCSARLPVYVLLIAAFIEPQYGATVAALTLFGMHLLGLLVAMPIAWVTNRFILKTPSLPFLLEIPPYRRPVWRDVFMRVGNRAGHFLARAGTVILAMSIVIWGLLYFPRPAEVETEVRTAYIAQLAAAEAVAPAKIAEQLAEPTSEQAEAWQSRLDQQVAGAYLEQSYLARIGKTIQPAFAAAGWDWKITVGVLGSFPAREVIIATLGIIYNLGDEVDEESGALQETLRSELWTAGPRLGTPIFTVPVALSIMVFFALCLQCGATIATIGKETTWRWAAITFSYMTVLAWLGAILAYQLASFVLGGA